MNSSYDFKKDSLMSRGHTVCFSENVSFILYMLNDNYHDMKQKTNENGLYTWKQWTHRYCGSACTKLYTL